MAIKAPGDLCGCEPWPVQPCCCETWPATWPEIEHNWCKLTRPLTVDERRALSARDIASRRLHILSGFRYGLCEDLVRPCGQMTCSKMQGPRYGQWMYPYVDAGKMYNCFCCECSCEVRCSIVLPGPVNDVLDVVVDGVTWKRNEQWTVNGEGAIVALDQCFPHSQDFTKHCGQPGAFCVRYLRGINPAADPDAIRAVSHLACAIYSSMCGGACPSLKGATRITRDGVEWEKTPGARDTGVEAADEWLDLINPRRMLQAARVLTRDLPRWAFRGVSEYDRMPWTTPTQEHP